jgi:chromosome segregation ATPase
VRKRRRTISHDDSISKSCESQSKERGSKNENEDRSRKRHYSEVASTDGFHNATTPNGSSSHEKSFEENRLDATRVFELESSIAEKERMLSQQKRTVELRDLQLQQERDMVRELRASLREEQRTKRDLQEQYEAINSEILVRNTREAIADSRMTELERELSELNLSLSSTRSENERLVQEIHQVRYLCRYRLDSSRKACFVSTHADLDRCDISEVHSLVCAASEDLVKTRAVHRNRVCSS